jgi:hypothetical protein|tara:strand:- start:43 stop:225 length:183 start_codon:yes stop_codon:yes gene_type:complete
MHRVNRNEERDKYIRELVDLVYSTLEGYEKYLLDEIKHGDLSRIMIALKKHVDESNTYLE